MTDLTILCFRDTASRVVSRWRLSKTTCSFCSGVYFLFSFCLSIAPPSFSKSSFYYLIPLSTISGTGQYNLSKITFPNNNYIEFDECQIYLNKKEFCVDNNGNSWYIELTNQKP